MDDAKSTAALTEWENRVAMLFLYRSGVNGKLHELLLRIGTSLKFSHDNVLKAAPDAVASAAPTRR
jgi:hypothetical protein